MVIFNLKPFLRRVCETVLHWLDTPQEKAIKIKKTEMLSEHFSRKELQCKCGCGRIGAYPNSLMKLVEKLERLREITGKPIHVTSGYRCPNWNYLNGGAENSYHMKDMAADIYVDELTENTLALKAEKAGFSGIGVYPRPGNMGWVHVDIGPNARWEG